MDRYEYTRQCQREYYYKHWDEVRKKQQQYAIRTGRENARTDFLLDQQDKWFMPMFEEILMNREIAEIEIKIKYRMRGNEDDKG